MFGNRGHHAIRKILRCTVVVLFSLLGTIVRGGAADEPYKVHIDALREVIEKCKDYGMSLEEIAQSLGTVGLREALTDWAFIGGIAAPFV